MNRAASRRNCPQWSEVRPRRRVRHRQVRLRGAAAPRDRGAIRRGIHSTVLWTDRAGPRGHIWDNGVSAVDLFFVISGFIMLVSTRSLATRPDGWRHREDAARGPGTRRRDRRFVSGREHGARTRVLPLRRASDYGTLTQPDARAIRAKTARPRSGVTKNPHAERSNTRGSGGTSRVSWL
jgi:hypothetical protein